LKESDEKADKKQGNKNKKKKIVDRLSVALSSLLMQIQVGIGSRLETLLDSLKCGYNDLDIQDI
jgi:hypothetical protein